MSVTLTLPVGELLNDEKLLSAVRKAHPRMWKCDSAFGHTHSNIHNFGLYDTRDQLYRFIDVEGIVRSKSRVDEDDQLLRFVDAEGIVRDKSRVEEDGPLYLSRSGGLLSSYYTFWGLTLEEKAEMVRRYPDMI